MADPSNLIERYVGDDWTVAPIALTAGSQPLDLTGAQVSAEVFAAWVLSAVAVLAEGSGITVAADRTTGVLTDLLVTRDVTAGIAPQDRRATTYPTRIDVSVTDSRGRKRVWLIIPVRPLDRRSDLPSAS